MLLLMECFGWELQNNSIEVEWDSTENLKEVKSRVTFSMHRV